MENKGIGGDNIYSIILPTYNERENIAILIWMINKHLEEK